MQSAPVVISGGGIGGLAVALTLHQIGVPCIVFEAVERLQPLGVGINLQPNAVRELYDLGIDDTALAAVGVQCREWALVGRNGNDVYAEPRGLEAGYQWPQYSVHRGALHMLLYDLVCDRLGADAVRTGHRVVGYRNEPDGVSVQVDTRSGGYQVRGRVLIGADGIHSAVRDQMFPCQPPVRWGGAIMWRGTSTARAIRTGASFVGLGSHRQRVVFYPITASAPNSGLATINWIAEVTTSGEQLRGDWNRRVDARRVAERFADWRYGWLDVPQLILTAPQVLEYPMIDRDPVPTWRDGNVALLGDAAHPMYPTGSNGATQAIVDARVLGRCMLDVGVNGDALGRYDGQLCAAISDVVLRNRNAGPFAILELLDARCGGVFEQIHDVISAQELAEHLESYKRAAGYAVEAVNAAPPTIPAGARVSS
jgi:2-polyprenyl-6-methoxyphenol hydroxylase-like FAD-dependent oxidoreductase